MAIQIRILKNIAENVNSEVVENLLDQCRQNFEILQKFALEYFHTGNTPEERLFQDQFYKDFEPLFSNEKTSEYFVSIMYCALIVGFPSLDYFYILADRKLHENGNDALDPQSFETFLKATHAHMVKKALKFLLFKRYLESLGVDSSANLYMVNNNSALFPAIEKYGDMESVLVGDFDNVSSDVYQNAVEYDEVISSMLYEIPSRRGYGLKQMVLSNEDATIRKLYLEYLSLGEA